MSEKEEGFFQIPYQRVSRDDVRLRLKKDKAKLPDVALSDEFMQEVANKMGGVLVNDEWWEILELAVEEVCGTFDINFETGVQCTDCGSYDTEFSSSTTHESQSVNIMIKTYYCNACDKYFNIEV